jgi:hypothetical protein
MAGREYMPFNKGQSGNPRGRPRKGKTLTDALEKAMKGKQADGRKKQDVLAETLINMAVVEKNIHALKYIYDRMDGRPKESIELTDGAIDTRLREIMSHDK